MSSIDVHVGELVLDFLRRLPPEPRHRLREAIRNLNEERGDTKALEGKLEGFHRLRVGSYRVIFLYDVVKGHRGIRCVFAGRRSTIYDTFIEMVNDRLREKRGESGEPLPPAKPKPYRIPKKAKASPSTAPNPKAKRSGSKADTASPPRSARTKAVPQSPE